MYSVVHHMLYTAAGRRTHQEKQQAKKRYGQINTINNFLSHPSSYRKSIDQYHDRNNQEPRNNMSSLATHLT